MKNTIRSFTFILLFFSFMSVFAIDKTYSPYVIGESLGKISQKSFKAMDQELNKKDFMLGFHDMLLDVKPDTNKISDQDSYEVGMIIAAQYKSKLKKMITINNTNSDEFFKGFSSSSKAQNNTLTKEDKQILKHFKISGKEDD